MGRGVKVGRVVDGVELFLWQLIGSSQAEVRHTSGKNLDGGQKAEETLAHTHTHQHTQQDHGS